MAKDFIGQVIYLSAVSYWRASQDDPLGILDKVCTPFAGCAVDFNTRECDVDVEHEWLTDPRTEFGALLISAFSPRADYAGLHEGDDELVERWWFDVYEPFRRRYRFCYLP